jgi:hypothetical protein
MVDNKIPVIKRNMKNLFYILVCLVISGCVDPALQARVPAGSSTNPIKPRVSRESLLTGGNLCNEDDICYDRKKRQDYDCSDEVSCVPINRKR